MYISIYVHNILIFFDEKGIVTSYKTAFVQLQIIEFLKTPTLN